VTTLTAILLIVALMACGMVLLIAEVAIIPGFGLAGISALALIIGGASFAWSRFGAAWGMGSLLLSGAATLAILKIVPRTRAGKSLVLSTKLKKSAVDGKLQQLVGLEGTTSTALRPAGAAEIDGRRLDVVTDGVFVEAGRPVRVVSVEGARIVVAPIS
jgi:membrane-bound serine protease (ClpP class)